MGLLNTSVCAAIIGLALVGSANAQDAELHPQLGKKPPLEFMNKELLKLPKTEQQAWLHGAVSMAAQVLAFKDQKAGNCVMDWYFKVGDGAEALPLWIERYPDKPVAATIMAVAQRGCPML